MVKEFLEYLKTKKSIAENPEEMFILSLLLDAHKLSENNLRAQSVSKESLRDSIFKNKDR